MYIEKIRYIRLQCSYTDVMNTKPLESVTSPSIYQYLCGLSRGTKIDRSAAYPCGKEYLVGRFKGYYIAYNCGHTL